MNTVFEDVGGPVNKTELVCFDVIILCEQELYVIITNYIVKDLLIFRYFDTILKDIIKLYDEASILAVQVANELQIFVSNTGELVKRPHLAFEDDLIALYLATSASTNTLDKKGKIWIEPISSITYDPYHPNGQGGSYVHCEIVTIFSGY